jgi:hypothetical protein
MLYVPPTMSVCVAPLEDRFHKASSFSPISHTERLDCMDDMAMPAIPSGGGGSSSRGGGGSGSGAMSFFRSDRYPSEHFLEKAG